MQLFLRLINLLHKFNWKETNVGKKEKTPIIIDEQEYFYEELTDEQKAYVNHIADLDRKIGSSQFNLEQLQFGKQAFVKALKEIL